MGGETTTTTSTAGQNLEITLQAECPSYKFDTKHTAWALCTVQAPEPEEEDEDKRAAADIVAVCDVSGSMSGNKIKLLRDSLNFIVSQLCERDRLGIVAFDSNVTTRLPLTSMTRSGKDSALAAVKSLNAGSCTNLSGGLFKGLAMMQAREMVSAATNGSCLLFTDGLANVGLQSTEAVSEAMKNIMANAPCSSKPSPSRERKMSNMITRSKAALSSALFGGSSSLNDDTVPMDESEETKEIAASSTAHRLAVYTFGFGSDHSADMLRVIADCGRGMYYFIESEASIARSFADALGGLLSVVAQNLMIKLETALPLTVLAMHAGSGTATITNGTHAQISISDLQAGERRDVLVELNLPEVDNAGLEHVVTASVSCFNTITKQLATTEAAPLLLLRPAETAERDEDSDVCKEIDAQRNRVDTVRAMAKAKELSEQCRYDEARSLLTAQRQCIAQSKSAKTANCVSLMNDLDLCHRYTTPATYETQGSKYMSSRFQSHAMQRSNIDSSDAYVSKKKAAFRSFF